MTKQPEFQNRLTIQSIRFKLFFLWNFLRVTKVLYSSTWKLWLYEWVLVMVWVMCILFCVSLCQCLHCFFYMLLHFDFALISCLQSLGDLKDLGDVMFCKDTNACWQLLINFCFNCQSALFFIYLFFVFVGPCSKFDQGNFIVLINTLYCYSNINVHNNLIIIPDNLHISLDYTIHISLPL